MTHDPTERRDADTDLTPSDISPDTRDTQLTSEPNDQSRDRINPKNQSNQIGEDARAAAKATDDTQDNAGLRQPASRRRVPEDYGRKENAEAKPPGSKTHPAIDIDRPTPAPASGSRLVSER